MYFLIHLRAVIIVLHRERPPNHVCPCLVNLEILGDKYINMTI